MYKNTRRRVREKLDKFKKSGKGTKRGPGRRCHTELERTRQEFTAASKRKPKAAKEISVSSRRSGRNSPKLRLQVPVEILGPEAKSKARGKNAAGLQEHGTNRNLLTLVQGDASFAPTLRRSKRLSAHTLPVQTHYKTVTDYYLKLEAEHVPSKHVKIGESSSLFEEINCRFRESVKPTFTVRSSEEAEAGLLNITSNFTVNVLHTPAPVFNESCFCENLTKELGAISLINRKLKSVNRIKLLVSEINSVLEGQKGTCSSKMQPKPLDQGNYQLVPCLIPQSRWSYQTPDKQKWKRSLAVDNNCSSMLKPYLVQTNRHSKVIVEVDASVANLNRFGETLNFTFDGLGVPVSQPGNQSLPFAGNRNSAFKLPFEFPKTACIRRNVMSIFNKRSMPLYEVMEESLDDIEPPVFTERPAKQSKRSLHSFTAVPRRLDFGANIKRQKLPFDSLEKRDESFDEFASDFELLSGIPEGGYQDVMASEHCVNFSSSHVGEDSRLLDFCNTGTSSAFQHDQGIVIDEELLLPPIPQLTEPSPLKFYPRKSFDPE